MQTILLVLIVIQIIIESFPISSSGHLLLAGTWLASLHNVDCVMLPLWLEHALHLVQLVVLAWYFKKPLHNLLKTMFYACFAQYNFYKNKIPMSFAQKQAITIGLRLAYYIVGTNSITIIGYFFIKPTIQTMKNTNVIMLTCIGFCITALFLFISKIITKQQRSLTLFGALLIGAGQAVTLIPGISRFAITVIAGRIFGLSMRRSLQYSFMVFAPLIIVAVIFNGLPTLFMMLHTVDVSMMCVLSSIALFFISIVISYSLFSLVCTIFLRNKAWYFAWYLLIPIISAIAYLFKINF